MIYTLCPCCEDRNKHANHMVCPSCERFLGKYEPIKKGNHRLSWEEEQELKEIGLTLPLQMNTYD